MAKEERDGRKIGLVILVAVGTGTVIGALIVLAVVGRRADRAPDPEAVDELTQKAHRVLDELSENVSALVGKSRSLLETVELETVQDTE